MQLVGFNFTKISGERADKFTRAKVNADLQFLNIERQKLDILKDDEAIKIFFRHSLTYDEENLNQKAPEQKENQKSEKKGEVLFEGNLLFSATKEEIKNITKSWKKKVLPKEIAVQAYNLILKKCAPRAFQLQDELGLPTHLRVPRLESK